MIEFDNDYYRVERTSVLQNANLSWRGKAKILRKDTNEIVDQCSVRFGHSPQEVEQQLDNSLQQKMANLQKPSDWGKDATTPALIRQYLAIRDETYGFVLKAESAPTKSKARAILIEGDAFEAAALNGLKKNIAKLSESQKVELVMPTSQQETNLENPKVLDELGAKKILYTLIDEPSSEVKAAYQAVEQLLSNS